MAENAVPGKGMLIFGKKSDGSYQMISVQSDGSVNINGSITASLGAFNPKGKAPLSVSGSSSRVALPTVDTGCLLRNIGSTDAYFNLGNSSVTAVVTDFLVKAGDALALDVSGYTHIAGITATGSTTFQVQTGTGLALVSQAGSGGGSGGNVNLNQVGGVSVALGQTTKSGSIPVTLASDQGNLPVNIAQIGGASLAFGQAAKTGSLPVTIANDQGAISATISDRNEISGTISSAAVFSNFPLTDTSGYRSLSLQVTSLAAASTVVAEESNDGSAWTNLVSQLGAASITATGLHVYNFSAKQVRVRQSVYGGSGSSGVTAEFRLAPMTPVQALGAGAVDARSNRVTLASDDPAVAGIGAIGDAAWSGSGNSSIIAALKAIYAKVAGTLTITGTVTANAGTNLNTSALAVESGGHLAAVDAVQGAVVDAAWTSGSGTVIALLKAIAAKIISSVAVTGTFWQATQPVSLAATVATKEVRSALGTRTSVAGAASSTTILASNAARLGAGIYNDSTAILYLDLSGGTATTGNYTVQLGPNDYYEPPANYTGLITGIWASAAGAAKVVEFT